VPTDGEPDGGNPLDGLAVSPVLSGYPAVAERELSRPLDDLLVDAESVTEELPAEEAEEAEETETPRRKLTPRTECSTPSRQRRSPWRSN